MSGGGIGLTLRDKHRRGKRQHQNRPAQPAGALQFLPQQSAREQHEQQIEQVQKTHGLKGLQAGQVRRSQQHDGHAKLEDPVDGQACRQMRQHGIAVAYPEAAKPPKEGQRS